MNRPTVKRKGLEGNGAVVAYFKTLSRHSPRDHKGSSVNRGFPDRSLNRVSPLYGFPFAFSWAPTALAFQYVFIFCCHLLHFPPPPHPHIHRSTNPGPCHFTLSRPRRAVFLIERQMELFQSQHGRTASREMLRNFGRC